MSYDIMLVPIEPGESFEDVLDRMEETIDEDSVLTPAQRSQWDRIEAELTQLWGDDVEAGVDDDGAEASDPRTGLTVTFSPGSASVSFPYWSHDDEAEFARQVAEVVGLLTRETGWTAYDPQTDAPFTGVSGEILDDVASKIESLVETPSAGRSRPAPGRSELLPDTRGRYLRYGVAGLVIFPIAVVLVIRDPSAASYWAALGLAVTNLAVAARIRRRMRGSA